MIILQKLSKEIQKKSFQSFSQDYIQKLISNWKKIESIVWRYMIKNFLYDKYWIDEAQLDFDLYQFDNKIFRSMSHIQDYVFLWIARNKIWLDIEYVKKRDKSLLDKFYNLEYKNLAFGKDWNSFYIIWTAKESLIKKLNLKLDDMENIWFEKYISDKNVDKYLIYNDKKIYFEYEFELKYLGDIYRWYSMNLENMILSLVV